MTRRAIRQQIIEDCASVFNTKGYQHVSIPEIETAAHKTKATLYGYFENRGQMAKVILAYNLTEKLRIINQLADDRPTALGKLTAHIDAHRPGAQLLVDGGCPILNAATEADDTNEELRAQAAGALIQWSQLIATLISNGISSGEIKPEVDPEKMALEFIALIEGAVFFGKTTQNADLCNQLLDTAAARITECQIDYMG
ncbi:TetR family transcriptional regulator [Mucilaginibacter yixingensis]|uniref:TetR family transcriptional regulator n=1 Tax=Mucilaginibacter yixingensis TaxID=1295612 RepID=A0A2T5JAG8_9SPHI|nr:TetR/AcrR family transcriptional regulator [Mucilaginibacter yixingensis]PTQ97856.1 TetR family transcriptional regulator [Mucilaginibacter yixingensis]